MNLTILSIAIGILVVLTIDIINNLVLGDRGKKNQLTDLYNYLKGEKVEKKRKKSSITFVSLEGLGKKYIYYVLTASVIIFFISIIAFKSLFMALLLSLFGFALPKAMRENAIKKRRNLVDIQFRDALNSITSSLKAGLSINSALLKCTEELERIYNAEKEKPILEEFWKIKNDLNMGISVDEALNSFKDRVKTEDAEDFVNSIIIVRHKGGNLVEVMSNVSNMITDKLSIKQEIERNTTGKKMESKILTIIPIFIVVSLSIFSPGYMEPLYGSSIGKLFIILGFGLLVINYFVGKKIIDIQV